MRIKVKADVKTTALCWVCAAALAIQILSLGSLPFELREPFDKVFHALAFGSLAMMLWIATGGRHPMRVIGGVMALGLADEIRQAFIPARSAELTDFLADALAACAVGAVLYWKQQGIPRSCAESSARSREET